MPSLARGQASSCSNPELDIFTTVNGVATDVAVLEFQIFEKVTDPDVPVQVFPTALGTRETVNAAVLCPGGHKLDTGHYVAAYTPPLTEATGTHEVRWFFKLTSGSPEQSFKEEFEVLPEVSGASAIGYATIQSLRDEGVTVAMASDARLQSILARVTALIDRYTGRHFAPQSKVIRVDGTGGPGFLLDEPIISVSQVRVLHSDLFAMSENGIEVDLDSVRIYNRHLSQNLLNPDDRENPRLEFLRIDSEHGIHPHLINWPAGVQSIEVTGVFGYTEYDGTATGRTPELIAHVARLMVIRELPLLADTDDRDDSGRLRNRIIRWKTRDQEIALASPVGIRNAAGAFTGDPEIDTILASFVRPPHLGAA